MNNIDAINEAAEMYADKYAVYEKDRPDMIRLFIDFVESGFAKQYWFEQFQLEEIVTKNVKLFKDLRDNETPQKQSAGVLNVKELPEVAQLDQVINTYVQGHDNTSVGQTYKHIQERFWMAIDAINKSTPTPQKQLSQSDGKEN